MILAICVLGDHIQSLGIVRIAGRLGYRVILINDDTMCISRFSKYCTKFITYRTESELFDNLTRLSESENGILLMPTNDRFVKYVVDHHEYLSSRFTMSTPAPAVLNVCYNKKLTYQKALELGIPIPESHFPETYEDITAISKNLSFPVIIKPSVMHNLYDMTGKKVYVCQNRDDLLRNYSKAIRIVKPSEIIIQKLIVGRAKNLYSYCSFFANSRVYGSFIAHRIRQKPMDFGISTTFAVSVLNEEIKKSATRFLKGIDYFGLSEVEFMYDPDDATYKLIEINPRTWKWHSIANKLGINLIQMLISYFNGIEIMKRENNKQDRGWIESITDTYVAVGEIIKGRMTLGEYLSTLSVEKEHACFDRRDPMPALGYMLLLPYLFFTR